MMGKMLIVLATTLFVFGKVQGSETIVANGGTYNISFNTRNVTAVNVSSNTILKPLNCSSLIKMNKGALYYNKTHYCCSCFLRDPLGIPIRLFMLCGCALWKPWKTHTCTLLFHSGEYAKIMLKKQTPEIVHKQNKNYRKLIMVSVVFAVAVTCVVVGMVLQRLRTRRMCQAKNNSDLNN